ncbi:MAG: signal peptidase I [Candidatus Omnitrophota bacterium]|nr:signal peptidase I [Candidatus Omnitrophota bacterium]MDZ4241758.1 signal peptidase I [Candidatus Omnitrophota bacterium]
MPNNPHPSNISAIYEKLTPRYPTLAMLLSFFLPGAGQIYLKQKGKGTALLCATTAFLGGFITIVANPSGESNKYLFLAPLVFLLYELFAAQDAFFSARALNAKHHLRPQPNARQQALMIAGTVLALIFNPFHYLKNQTNDIIQIFRINSSSMEPTFRKGEVCLIDKSVYRLWNPKPGDVIVFNAPQDIDRLFVKRFIAKEHQTVEIRNGKVIVNNAPLDMKGMAAIRYANAGPYGTPGTALKVPPGHYYVLGDNSASSKDSRDWGYLPNGYLVGKVYKSYFPVDFIGRLLIR